MSSRTSDPPAAVVVPDDVNGAYAASSELERLHAVADVHLHGTRPQDEAELIERIREAEVVLSFRPAFTRFPQAVIRGAPKLRMICISGTGV